MGDLTKNYKDIAKYAYQLSDKRVPESTFIKICKDYFKLIKELLNDKSVTPIMVSNFVKLVPNLYKVEKELIFMETHYPEKVELIERYKFIIHYFKTHYTNGKIKRTAIDESSREEQN